MEYPEGRARNARIIARKPAQSPTAMLVTSPAVDSIANDRRYFFLEPNCPLGSVPNALDTGGDRLVEDTSSRTQSTEA